MTQGRAALALSNSLDHNPQTYSHAHFLPSQTFHFASHDDSGSALPRQTLIILPVPWLFLELDWKPLFLCPFVISSLLNLTVVRASDLKKLLNNPLSFSIGNRSRTYFQNERRIKLNSPLSELVLASRSFMCWKATGCSPPGQGLDQHDSVSLCILQNSSGGTF